MERRTVTNDGIRIDTKRGTALFQEPCPGVVVYSLVGFADVELHRAVVADMHAAAARTGRIEFFVDAGQLDGYDGRFRIEWTNWLTVNRNKLVDIHVYVQSQLTRMGLSVVNLATGGMLRGYDSITAFDAALRKRAPAWKRQRIHAAS